MARLTVKLYAALKDSAGTGRIDAEGADLPAVLVDLRRKGGETFATVLFDDGGSVRPGYQLLLGTRYLDPGSWARWRSRTATPCT